MIIFQSDNGAEGATYEAIPTMGEDLMRVINEYCKGNLIKDTIEIKLLSVS